MSSIFLIAMTLFGNAYAVNSVNFDNAMSSYLPVKKVILDGQQAKNYSCSEGDEILVARDEAEIRKHLKDWNMKTKYNYIKEVQLKNQISSKLVSQGIFLFEIQSDSACHACSPEIWILDSREPAPSITKVSLGGQWGLVDGDIKINTAKGSIYIAQTGKDMHQGYISTYVHLERYSLKYRTSRTVYLKKYSTDNPAEENDSHATWDHQIDFLDDSVRILTFADISSCKPQNFIKRVISAILNSCTNNSVGRFEDIIFYSND